MTGQPCRPLGWLSALVPLFLLLPAAASAVTYISLEMDKCQFRPDSFRLTQQQEYALVLQSHAGIGEKDFVVNDPKGELNMGRLFNSDRVQIIRLLPTKVGKYTFDCDRSM